MSYLKVVCNYIFIVTLRRNTASALVHSELLVEIHKNSNISPAIVTYEFLCERIVIFEIGLDLAGTVVSIVRKIMNENSYVDVRRPQLGDFCRRREE
jgi:hypothetical protein